MASGVRRSPIRQRLIGLEIVFLINRATNIILFVTRELGLVSRILRFETSCLNSIVVFWAGMPKKWWH